MQALKSGQTFVAVCHNTETRKRLHKAAESVKGVSHFTAAGDVLRAWHRNRAVLAIFQALSPLPEGVCQGLVQDYLDDDKELRGEHDERVAVRQQDRRDRRQAKRERREARTRECEGCGEYTAHLVSVYVEGCYCSDCIHADEELDGTKWESIR